MHGLLAEVLKKWYMHPFLQTS